MVCALFSFLCLKKYNAFVRPKYIWLFFTRIFNVLSHFFAWGKNNFYFLYKFVQNYDGLVCCSTYKFESVIIFINRPKIYPEWKFIKQLYDSSLVDTYINIQSNVSNKTFEKINLKKSCKLRFNCIKQTIMFHLTLR